MRTTAAILVELDAPLEIVELEMPALKLGQVMVELAFAGICHTQLLEIRGKRGPDAFLPHCLGHEGSGIVVEIGAGVTKVKPGDEVVLSWIKGNGLDVPGTVYRWDARDVNAGGVTTFGRRMIASENRLTRKPRELAMREAALLGCAVPTGFGAVYNSGQFRPGDKVAVFGAGGIGLSAIAAAVAGGAAVVVAIDKLAAKLDVARRLGATHTIDASVGDVGAAIRDQVGLVDLAIEATGQPAVMAAALDSVRPQGGRAVIVGNAAHASTVTLDPRQFNQGKSLLGSWGGDSRPDTDFPRYAGIIAARDGCVAPLVERSYGLQEINKAVSDLEEGRVLRPLIDLALAGAAA
jgi:S-(hydroxymethyl)glutathione dehydrogenase / alcohol dehydrogenase